MAKVRVKHRWRSLYIANQRLWNNQTRTSVKIHEMNIVHQLHILQFKLPKAIIVGFVIVLGFLLYIFWDLPSLDSLPNSYMTPSVRVTDRNGQLLYEIIPQNGGRNTVLSIDSIPQCLKDATIAVEDKNFYVNPGIDITGIIRGLWINIKGG